MRDQDLFSVAELEIQRYANDMSAITANEYELLAFFGRDPEVLDHGVPWIYNTLTYRHTDGSTACIFIIAPSYKSLSLKLLKADQINYEFERDVEDVLYVETAMDEQLLRIRISRDTELLLYLRPTIKLSKIGLKQ